MCKKNDNVNIVNYYMTINFEKGIPQSTKRYNIIENVY